jgi:predicted nucleic-acid-binding Zn-ribbon protein
MNDFNYICHKCSHTSCEVGEMRAAGGFWHKIFDLFTN